MIVGSKVDLPNKYAYDCHFNPLATDTISSLSPQSPSETVAFITRQQLQESGLRGGCKLCQGNTRLVRRDEREDQHQCRYVDPNHLVGFRAPNIDTIFPCISPAPAPIAILVVDAPPAVIFTRPMCTAEVFRLALAEVEKCSPGKKDSAQPQRGCIIM